MTIQQDACQLIAPRWHTALLAFVVVAVAVTGTLLTQLGATLPRVEDVRGACGAMTYLPLVVVQWSLVLYVTRVARPKGAWSRYLGARLRPSDLVLATVLAVIIIGTEAASAHFLGASRSDAVATLVPRSRSERSAWIVVALSVGFCEEVVYRGYFQTQLVHFTRWAPSGIVLQGVLFGVAHADQGLAAASRIGLYGVALGAVAARRRSLAPTILCHGGIDLAAGLFGR